MKVQYKIIIMMWLSIMIISSVYAVCEYQEIPASRNVWFTDPSDVINVSFINDSDWNTYATPINPFTILWYNYFDKPTGYNKYNLYYKINGEGIQNYTNNVCMGDNDIFLVIEASTVFNDAKIRCYNGGYTTINYSAWANDGRIYELAMNWTVNLSVTWTGMTITGDNITKTNLTIVPIYTNNNGCNLTEYAYVRNMNDSATWTKLSSMNYIINETDFMDELQFMTEVCDPTECSNSSNLTIKSGVIDSVINLYAKSSYDNSSISGRQFEFLNLSKTKTNFILMSEFLNSTYKSHTETINVSDTNLYHKSMITTQTINENVTNITRTLTAIATYLNFYHDHVQQGADGVRLQFGCAENDTHHFNTNNYPLIQDKLCGKVSIYFQHNETQLQNGSFRQKYEFYVDDITLKNISIEVMNGTNPIRLYFSVVNSEGKALPDTYITVNAKIDDNDGNLSIIGQLITDDNGQAEIYVDRHKIVIAQFTKDGYVPRQFNIETGDWIWNPYFGTLLYTDQQYSVELKKSDFGTFGLNYAYPYPLSFHNRSDNLYIIIKSPISEYVVWQTKYMRDSLMNATYICRFNDMACVLNISPGDYKSTGTDDVTVYMYFPDSPTITRVIKFREENVEILTLEGLDQDYRKWIAGITLLMLIIFLQFVVKSETVGATVFRIGGVALAIILPTVYWWLGMIIVMEFVFGLIKPVAIEN